MESVSIEFGGFQILGETRKVRHAGLHDHVRTPAATCRYLATLLL